MPVDLEPRSRRGPRWSRYGGLAWVAVWLFPLLNPLFNAPGPVAVAGLAGFVLLYTIVTWHAFESMYRQRWHTAGFAAVAGLGVVLAIGYGAAWLTVLLYVSVCAVAVFGGTAQPTAAIVLPVLVGVAIVVIGFGRHEPAGVVLAVLFSTGLGSALVFTVRQMSRLIRELSATREALALAAVAEERLRFSRDLHDLLGHTLSLIVVKAEVVRRLAGRDPAAAAAQAADIEQVGRRALAEVREAVTGYREGGLTAELAAARTAMSAAEIALTVRRAPTSLPTTTDRLLAWVVREATTNVLRHSNATTCEIEITTEPATVGPPTGGPPTDGPATTEPATTESATTESAMTGPVAAAVGGSGGAFGTGGGDSIAVVRVCDDGRYAGTEPEAAPASGGTGLRGLAERLATVVGSLVTGPRTGGGFVLTARVPLGPAPAPGGER